MCCGNEWFPLQETTKCIPAGRVLAGAEAIAQLPYAGAAVWARNSACYEVLCWSALCFATERYMCVDGWDMRGDDLVLYIRYGFDDCMRACEARLDCAVFVYGTFSWGTCVLKWVAMQLRRRIVAYSGEE